jgi:hypothetical protein
MGKADGTRPFRPATIAGVEVVTIPVADYAELLDCRRRLAESEVGRRAFMQPLRSRIEGDPEVATFLAGRFGLIDVIEALRQCGARFGAARTPSRSAAFRYRDRLRAAAAK